MHVFANIHGHRCNLEPNCSVCGMLLSVTTTKLPVLKIVQNIVFTFNLCLLSSYYKNMYIYLHIRSWNYLLHKFYQISVFMVHLSDLDNMVITCENFHPIYVSKHRFIRLTNLIIMSSGWKKLFVIICVQQYFIFQSYCLSIVVQTGLSTATVHPNILCQT